MSNATLAGHVCYTLSRLCLEAARERELLRVASASVREQPPFVGLTLLTRRGSVMARRLYSLHVGQGPPEARHGHHHAVHLTLVPLLHIGEDGATVRAGSGGESDKVLAGTLRLGEKDLVIKPQGGYNSTVFKGWFLLERTFLDVGGFSLPQVIVGYTAAAGDKPPRSAFQMNVIAF